MAITTHNFNSTALEQARYDDTTQTLSLWVKNKQGSTCYHYEDVPEDVFNELCLAPSAGRYFGKNINRKYSFTKVVAPTSNSSQTLNKPNRFLNPMGAVAAFFSSQIEL